MLHPEHLLHLHTVGQNINKTTCIVIFCLFLLTASKSKTTPYHTHTLEKDTHITLWTISSCVPSGSMLPSSCINGTKEKPKIFFSPFSLARKQERSAAQPRSSIYSVCSSKSDTVWKKHVLPPIKNHQCRGSQSSTAAHASLNAFRCGANLAHPIHLTCISLQEARRDWNPQVSRVIPSEQTGFRLKQFECILLRWALQTVIRTINISMIRTGKASFHLVCFDWSSVLHIHYISGPQHTKTGCQDESTLRYCISLIVH